MNVIKTSLSPTLSKVLDEIHNSMREHFETNKTLINHKLFWCNKWTEEKNAKYQFVIDMLRQESQHLADNFDKNTLLQLNLICAPPDCVDQVFHIDYLGDSISYFLPLVDLTDLNGTEYLFFFDSSNYLKHFDLMLEMSDKYFNKDEAIAYMIGKGFVYGEGEGEGADFCFKCANAPAYSIVEMPYYTYHRGQKNKTNKNRVMLNILLSRNNGYNYPTDEVIMDSELDEEQRVDIINEKRKKAEAVETETNTNETLKCAMMF
jgi:hypothetical protein